MFLLGTADRTKRLSRVPYGKVTLIIEDQIRMFIISNLETPKLYLLGLYIFFKIKVANCILCEYGIKYCQIHSR